MRTRADIPVGGKPERKKAAHSEGPSFKSLTRPLLRRQGGGFSRCPIASNAKSGEADQNHRPGRRLGNAGGWGHSREVEGRRGRCGGVADQQGCWVGWVGAQPEIGRGVGGSGHVERCDRRARAVLNRDDPGRVGHPVGRGETDCVKVDLVVRAEAADCRAERSAALQSHHFERRAAPESDLARLKPQVRQAASMAAFQTIVHRALWPRSNTSNPRSA